MSMFQQTRSTLLLAMVLLASTVMTRINACPMEDTSSQPPKGVVSIEAWHPPTPEELSAEPADGWARRWDKYRPECREIKIQYDSVGLCMNPNMDKALKLASSKDYQQTVGRIFDNAETYLSRLEGSKSNVVLVDLDETLVNNLPFLSQYKSFDGGDWPAWQNQINPSSYTNTRLVSLLQSAKSRGFSIMFITGRPMRFAEVTVKQLGSFGWDGMYFRPEGKAIVASQYKQKMRDTLKAFGYSIVMNLGDQYSDFELPIRSSEGEFILPNVLYSIP